MSCSRNYQLTKFLKLRVFCTRKGLNDVNSSGPTFRRFSFSRRINAAASSLYKHRQGCSYDKACQALSCQGAFEVPYAEDLRRGVSKIIM